MSHVMCRVEILRNRGDAEEVDHALEGVRLALDQRGIVGRECLCQGLQQRD